MFNKCSENKGTDLCLYFCIYAKIRFSYNMAEIMYFKYAITMVPNAIWQWKATGLKASKFMGIQSQEENIGHVKQNLKSERYHDRKFLSQA